MRICACNHVYPATFSSGTCTPNCNVTIQRQGSGKSVPLLYGQFLAGGGATSSAVLPSFTAVKQLLVQGGGFGLPSIHRQILSRKHFSRIGSVMCLVKRQSHFCSSYAFKTQLKTVKSYAAFVWEFIDYFLIYLSIECSQVRVGKHQGMHSKCMMNYEVGSKFPAG